jgi:anti-sigma regulatory factor (Ser/Thr protein kinase)
MRPKAADGVLIFMPALRGSHVECSPGPSPDPVLVYVASICAECRGSNMAGNGVYWSHQATFEASPLSASRARDFVTHHLIDHRLLYLVDPVRLVASELATNALIHAQTAFTVTLEASEQTVLLTVRDNSLALPTRRAAQAMDPAGRGLTIVDIISHDWGINEDRARSKAVWASFALRQRSVERARTG